MHPYEMAAVIGLLTGMAIGAEPVAPATRAAWDSADLVVLAEVVSVDEPVVEEMGVSTTIVRVRPIRWLKGTGEAFLLEIRLDSVVHPEVRPLPLLSAGATAYLFLVATSVEGRWQPCDPFCGVLPAEYALRRLLEGWAREASSAAGGDAGIGDGD